MCIRDSLLCRQQKIWFVCRSYAYCRIYRWDKSGFRFQGRYLLL